MRQNKDGLHTAIISEEVFNKAQELHGIKDKPTTFNRKYFLSGLLRCSERDSQMTSSHIEKLNKGRKYKRRCYYYRCTKTFRGGWYARSTRRASA